MRLVRLAQVPAAELPAAAEAVRIAMTDAFEKLEAE